MKRPAGRCDHARSSHSSFHSLGICHRASPTAGPWARRGARPPGADRETETSSTEGGGTPAWASRALPPTARTPRCHAEGRCVTEGCPRGSRGPVGTGFTDKGRTTCRGPGQVEGHLGGGAGSARRLCHLIPLPGPWQAGRGGARRQSLGRRAGFPWLPRSRGPGWGPWGRAQGQEPGMSGKAGARSFRGWPRGLAGGPRTHVDVVTLRSGAGASGTG